MTDVFHSFEGSTTGISIKVLRDGAGHRRSIGVGDYKTKSEYIAAAEALLEGVIGTKLATIAAVISANKDDKAEAIAALKAEHAAHCAKLEADIAILGTKEEAAEMRKAQAIANIQAEIAAKNAELAKLLPAELEPVDARL